MLSGLCQTNGGLELKNASTHSELGPEDLRSLLSDLLPLKLYILSYLQLLTVCVLYGKLGILQPGWKRDKISVQSL